MNRLVKSSVLSLFLIAGVGCTTHRFNSVIGHPKSYVVDVIGVPDRSVKLRDGTEVWAYPAGSESTTSSAVDRSPGAPDPIIQGLAEGISDSVVTSIFGRGPARYVFIGADGNVIRWEYRSITR